MIPMKTLIDQLAQYAAYHRDHRNIWTHFIGIPMIVLSVVTLLSRQVLAAPHVGAYVLYITPALLVSAVVSVYYLRLDLRYGLVMAALLGLCCAAADTFALGTSSMLWLGAGVGLFVVGWIIQFVGHYFEGRKPAFVDDLIGLLIGPLFIVAEAGFLLGLRRDVHDAVVARAGAVR